MLTNNLHHQDQAWTVCFVRFAAISVTFLLSEILVFVGSDVQAPL